MQKTDSHIVHYSEKGLWAKLRHYAKSAGLAVVEKVLLLYYASQEDSVPLWAKTTMLGALGYFISPIDAIPDLTPVLGYSDDLSILILAISVVAMHINDDARRKARAKLGDWFDSHS